MGHHQGIRPEYATFVEQATKDPPLTSYTYAELAAALKVSVQTIEMWVKRGQIPSPMYLGSTARFSLESLKQIMCGVRMPHTYEVADSPRSVAARAGIAAKKAAKRKKTYNQKLAVDRTDPTGIPKKTITKSPRGSRPQPKPKGKK